MGKLYKDTPNLSLSFFTRYTTMEYCFGDVAEEEENLAYSILKSLKKVHIFRLFHYKFVVKC